MVLPWVIATFSNVDTVLECVYGETHPLGQKKGACRDNWGNRYWLYITPSDPKKFAHGLWDVAGSFLFPSRF